MTLQTVRVALIDDDLDYASKVRQVLRPAQGSLFELRHFATLKSALEGLKSTHFDAVLLVLDLPDSNGLRTLSRVMAAAQRLPVLVLNDGNISSSVLERIKNSGRTSLLKSRFSPPALAAALLRGTNSFTHG